MSAYPPLPRPIIADVDGEGRLVHADDTLRRLHLRAGGEEGGAFAVPALAALAALARRLKMRLARAVRIADGEEDVELWVEAALVGEVVRLSVTSWRAIPGDGGESGPVKEAFQAFDGKTSLFFDRELRLIGTQGPVPEQIGPADFGNVVEGILGKLFGPESEAAAAHIRAWQNIDAIDFARGGGLSGEAMQAMDGTFSGYRCELTLPPVQEAVQDRTARAPDAMFGAQLAPMLRQPLGRIIANAETIGNELNGPVREHYSTYARDIADAARHLAALVEDLGDLEAVERPGFTTAPDKIELGDVARRVSGLLALKAADHSIRITIPAEAEKVHAVAEFRRVLQIMLNLVTNAIRYSPDGTEVTIDIAADDSQSKIAVSDQGGGIAVEDRERIFEKFERLGRSGDGGSGLGLYISRRLARAMGGELSVDAAAGGGAKFILTLPRSIRN